MTSEEDWKDRYLTELEAAEKREQVWKTRRNMLERMLVRTSLASEGQDRELDQSLARLRQLLRANDGPPGEWQVLQEQIEKRINHLDNRRTESGRNLQESLETALSAARVNPQFVHYRDHVRELEKALRRPGTLREGLADWLQEFCALLSEAMADPAEGGRPKSGGLLARLFGAPREATDDAPASDTSPAIEDPSDHPGVDLDSGEREESDERLRIARRVGELLGHLQQQVVLEPAVHARARRLQQELLNSDDWEELQEGLSGVAELVIAAVTRSQREFEGFLRRLDERLRALQEHFSEQEAAQSGRMDATQELDQEIREELASFGRRVEESENLGELKDSVTGHLTAISSSIGQFHERETEREEMLARRLETMQQKMAAVEAHCEQMTEQLSQERSRALTDLLTTLPNREAWEERLGFEFNRWERYHHPLSVAVLDIDFFKRVNDSYGHKSGDRVLQLMAKSLRDRLRNTDFVARYGGEEFVILLPDTDQQTARHVLDQVREHVTGLPFHFRGEPVSISFSAGVSEFREGDEPDGVFDRADRALYDAKSAGRNRILVSGEEDARSE